MALPPKTLNSFGIISNYHLDSAYRTLPTDEQQFRFSATVYVDGKIKFGCDILGYVLSFVSIGVCLMLQVSVVCFLGEYNIPRPTG